MVVVPAQGDLEDDGSPCVSGAKSSVWHKAVPLSMTHVAVLVFVGPLLQGAPQILEAGERLSLLSSALAPQTGSRS